MRIFLYLIFLKLDLCDLLRLINKIFKQCYSLHDCWKVILSEANKNDEILKNGIKCGFNLEIINLAFVKHHRLSSSCSNCKEI